MGSDESHFNVSLIVRDKVTRHCPQTTISDVKGVPKRNRTEVLLLTTLTPKSQLRRPRWPLLGVWASWQRFTGVPLAPALTRQV